MKYSQIVKLNALLAGAALLLEVTAAAQYPQPSERYPAEWETERFRVRRATIPAGGQVDEADGRDSVVVVLSRLR